MVEPRIVYRDDDFVVVDKPAGLLVHRTQLSGTREACLQLVRDRIGRRVYPVHRLDRPTSGLLAFGLTPEAAESLAGLVDYPLLVQGEASRGQLIDEFVRRGNAVLLGTGTFWQGVDVRGPVLSVVIIDKLPFAPPAEPITKARIRRIDELGGSGFKDFQIPEAVISLKQGAGRLIRDVGDCGVLMLCDPRLRTKHYGRTFLKALPDMPRTSSFDEVREMLQNLSESGAAQNGQ